jgi:hypothetical protein
MRHETREVRKVREHEFGLEAEGAFERLFDVVLEVDHLETVGSEVPRHAAGSRDANVVPASDEPLRRRTGTQRAPEPVARHAIKDAHARSYVDDGGFSPRDLNRKTGQSARRPEEFYWFSKKTNSPDFRPSPFL